MVLLLAVMLLLPLAGPVSGEVRGGRGECREGVRARARSGEGEGGGEESVGRREVGGGGDVTVERREEGGAGVRSVVEGWLLVDTVLEAWRRAGGSGGGDLYDWGKGWVGSLIRLGLGASEICEEIVREELLRDRFCPVEDRSVLCRLDNGGAGGIFFCGGAGSDEPEGYSMGLGCSTGSSRPLSCGSGGGEEASGGGGRGLFRSEFVLFNCGDVGAPGDNGFCGVGRANEGEKSAKETVCGVLDATNFPCRCFGGGGFFFSVFRLSVIKLAVSSSSEPAVSYDVRGDSVWVSCIGSKIDCRDIDDVSVLLLLSRIAPLIEFCRTG